MLTKSMSMLVACVDAAPKVLHPIQAAIQLMAQADLATCIHIKFPWQPVFSPQGCIDDYSVWQYML